MNYHKDNGLLNMIRRTEPMIKEAVSLPARSRISFLVRRHELFIPRAGNFFSQSREQISQAVSIIPGLSVTGVTVIFVLKKLTQILFIYIIYINNSQTEVQERKNSCHGCHACHAFFVLPFVFSCRIMKAENSQKLLHKYLFCISFFRNFARICRISLYKGNLEN